MNALIHAHSGLRWVALILIIFAIINAFSKKGSSLYEKKDKMSNLFAMISLHTQLLIGFVVYFMSGKVNFSEGWMKNALTRFFGMEHVIMMIASIVIITIGRKKAEKAEAPFTKHQYIAKWYLIGLIILLAGIPWPFRTNLAAAWF
jgi:ABC-type xylose transport system permease subunit